VIDSCMSSHEERLDENSGVPRLIAGLLRFSFTNRGILELSVLRLSSYYGGAVQHQTRPPL
jgi:hypothetical protein